MIRSFMRRVTHSVLWVLIVFAVLLGVSTAALWFESAGRQLSAGGSLAQRKIGFSADSRGVSLHVSCLAPSTMVISGLDDQAIKRAGSRLSISATQISIGLSASPLLLATNVTGLSVTQTVFDRWGITWTSGFTSANASFPGPISVFKFSTYWISYWDFLVLAAGLFVLTFFLLRRVRRMHQPGFCGQCGYDLRATPERCPECGAVSGAAAF